MNSPVWWECMLYIYIFVIYCCWTQALRSVSLFFPLAHFPTPIPCSHEQKTTAAAWSRSVERCLLLAWKHVRLYRFVVLHWGCSHRLKVLILFLYKDRTCQRSSLTSVELRQLFLTQPEGQIPQGKCRRDKTMSISHGMHSEPSLYTQEGTWVYTPHSQKWQGFIFTGITLLNEKHCLRCFKLFCCPFVLFLEHKEALFLKIFFKNFRSFQSSL